MKIEDLILKLQQEKNKKGNIDVIFPTHRKSRQLFESCELEKDVINNFYILEGYYLDS